MALLMASWLAVAGQASAQAPHTHDHSFGEAKEWSHVFDDPKRDEWQKPHQVIRALKLKPDAAVADVGAGTGYFAMRLANMLPQGRVYAVDLEPGMVKHLAERATREGLKNVTPVLAKPDDARIPAKLDLVLMVDVHHHIDNREAYFRKLASSLKPGGRIAIIDFKLDSPQGPPKSARVSPDRVKAELGRAGFVLADEQTFLPHQYFLVFTPR
jgi:predicted methyltransferase